MTFNGNDVVALLNGADTLDRLGVVGVSANFKFDTTNAVNFTFVRKPSVQQGTKDWAVSTLQWIQFPQDTIRLGAHTMDACGAITDTIARFSPSALSVSESAGTAVVNVVLNTASTSSTFSVDVVYEGGTGTIDDISNYTTQTLTFAPNSSSQAFSVNINDDTNNEASETFVFKLRNATGGILIGDDSTYTLTISASDAPISIVTISQLTSLDSVSSPDSLGKKVQVTGTVYGINNRAQQVCSLLFMMAQMAFRCFHQHQISVTAFNRRRLSYRER
jgi:hypothetical protein